MKYALAMPCIAAALGIAWAAFADDSTAPPQDFAVHGQTTIIDQANLAFHSPYEGANSLPAIAEGRETADISLYVGIRPWRGGELWFDPEFDQGFGLHNTLGVAGFPNGEGAKVGRPNFYFRLPRLFLRQTIDLGGAKQPTDPDFNQLGGATTQDRLVLTVGKFNVTDVFDTNTYAHDPKHDFLNWALIDAGTFDYAADAWGYTVGAAGEWYVGDWTWRLGVFDLSIVPNAEKLDPHFSQFQAVGEIERRFKLAGHDGAARVTGFLSRGRMGTFADAIALGQATHTTPDTAAVRRYRSRGGVSLSLQQDLGRGWGLFARAGTSSGSVEPYEYADIDRTVSAGVSLKGQGWGRKDDTVALAGVVNQISAIHQAYLAGGGLGILVGDGRLPHPGTENILEAYYDIAITKAVHLSVDYQFIDNPAYNTDRGPVSVFAGRLHAQF